MPSLRMPLHPVAPAGRWLGLFLVAVAASLLLLGCGSVSKEQAEGAARQFLAANVKFYSRENSTNSTVILPRVDLSNMDSYREGGDWMVVAHVTGAMGNATRKNDLLVRVSGSTGKVTEFNGARVGP